jgi:dynein regulatory complex subunit 2
MPPKKRGARRPRLTPEQVAAKAEAERQAAVADLMARAKKEMQLARAKRSDVDAKWRHILADAHTEKQRELVRVLSAEFERVVDAKDAQLSRLLEHLEEAKEQYDMSVRAHLANAEGLREIHEQRVERMRQELHEELQEWQDAFDQERDMIANKYARDRAEMVDIIRAMDEHHQHEIDTERRRIQEQRNSVKNKHTEEFEGVRVGLQKRIAELEDHFQQTLDTYERTTEVEIQKMQERIADDDKKSAAIDLNNRRLERIQRSIAHWRAKMASNTKECEQRNQSLKEEKDAIVSHFHQLKTRMNRFVDNQNERMVHLTQAADAAIKELDNRLKLAERILVLSKLTAKLQTEREKVQPLGDAPQVTDAEVAQEAAERAEASGVEQADPLATTRTLWNAQSQQAAAHEGACIIDENGELVEPWDAMKNFYKRVNKVQLDNAALEHEEEALLRENRELKEAVSRYADGTTVTDGTLGQDDNSLLIVNDRTPHAIALGEAVQSVGSGVPMDDFGLTVTAATLLDTVEHTEDTPDEEKVIHHVAPAKTRHQEKAKRRERHRREREVEEEPELVYVHEYA